MPARYGRSRRSWPLVCRTTATRTWSPCASSRASATPALSRCRRRPTRCTSRSTWRGSNRNATGTLAGRWPMTRIPSAPPRPGNWRLWRFLAWCARRSRSSWPSCSNMPATNCWPESRTARAMPSPAAARRYRASSTCAWCSTPATWTLRASFRAPRRCGMSSWRSTRPARWIPPRWPRASSAASSHTWRTMFSGRWTRRSPTSSWMKPATSPSSARASCRSSTPKAPGTTSSVSTGTPTK